MKQTKANDDAAANLQTATPSEAETRQGKVLKSLTMPQRVAQQLEQLAKQTKTKQADIVKVAFYELQKRDTKELNDLFIEYEIY